ncbi:universal stress protein [Austwickia chelonae]|uniref:universal stress protein n=1 Tax=Austwickia chelonae TaxID=100225 RepID=UPI000E285FAB
MTTTRWPHHSARRPSVGDVVAGLLAGDGSTSAVARAAVREAVSRGARVRFLQVLPSGLTPEERAACDESTFAAALRALREAPRLPVTFEVVDGDPGEILCSRSASASVLVVAHDLPGEEQGVANYCFTHAECDVLTVHPETASRIPR